MLTQEETLHWLALRMVPGLGTVGTLRVLEKLKSPQAIFRASASELEAAGTSPAQARNIASGCSFEDAVEQQQQIMNAAPSSSRSTTGVIRNGCAKFSTRRCCCLQSEGRVDDGAFQSRLWARGGQLLTGSPQPSGSAAIFARAGLTIVSGMARGIDTAAHKAALAKTATPSPFLGCGVDVLYPADNRQLYDDIARRGLMVSEFPMGAPAYPQNFPIRNRIVSGLSLGVLIVEGASTAARHYRSACHGPGHGKFSPCRATSPRK